MFLKNKLGIKVTNIAIGTFKNSSSCIKTKNATFYYSNKVAFTVSSAVIYYHQTLKAFGNDQILAVDKLQYLEFKDITLLEPREGQKYDELYAMLDKTAHKCKNLLIFSIRNIDELIINHENKFIVPSPSCKHLKLVIKMNCVDKFLGKFLISAILNMIFCFI